MHRSPARAGENRSRRTAAQFRRLAGRLRPAIIFGPLRLKLPRSLAPTRRTTISFTTTRSPSIQLPAACFASPAQTRPLGSLRVSNQLAAGLRLFRTEHRGLEGTAAAHKLSPVYRTALDLRAKVDASSLDPQSKASLLFEVDAKIDQFQIALKNLLGLDLVAFATKSTNAQESGGFRGGGADETPRSVSPGEDFYVRIHTARAAAEVHMAKTWLVTENGGDWQHGDPVSINSTPTTSDAIFKLHVPDETQPTQPYFTRPNIEQAYYDLTQPQYRERSFAPWPLAAWVEFTFDDVPIRMGEVVQTMQRVLGPGGVFEPLVVTPAIGVRMDPQARIRRLTVGFAGTRDRTRTGCRRRDRRVSIFPPAGQLSLLPRPFIFPQPATPSRFCSRLHPTRPRPARTPSGHKPTRPATPTNPAGSPSATPACALITFTALHRCSPAKWM